MTQRDRIIVAVVALAAVLGAFWFAVLTPKQREVKRLDDDIALVEQRLAQASAGAAAAEAARSRYARDYATVVHLGKAVTVDDSTASLVFQLKQAADSADMRLGAVRLTPPAAPAGTGAAAAVAAVAAGENGTGASASGTTTDGTSSGSASGTTTDGAGATATATTTTATPTPAAPAATATVSPAGFVAMPFTFDLTGRFFDTQGMLRAIDRFVTISDEAINVRGRLISINGFALVAGPSGFPQMRATVTATAYVLPASEGLTAGATPTAPAGAPTASGGTSIPTPSATVTGVLP